MMGIFAPDGKLARFLNKIGDLILLNIMTLICCIPIVTIGAALTALHANTLKMARNEEGKVISGYFKAFRENFKQATVLWLISAAIMGFIAFDIYILRYATYTFVDEYKGILLVVLVLVAMVVMYLFPVLARFENTTKNTMKNAAMFFVIHPIQSLFMLLANLLPFALLFLSFRFLSVDFLIGLSGPAFITGIYYRSVFEKYEVQPETQSEMAEGEA